MYSSFDLLVAAGPAPGLPVGAVDSLSVAGRALLVYMISLMLIRLGKSRLLSGSNPSDLLVTIMLGALLARGIAGTASLVTTIAGSATLIAVHWAISRLACDWHWFGNLVKGHVRVLVKDGIVDHQNLRHSHMSVHDLYEELRLGANIDQVDRVETAVKERNGHIGVVKRRPELSVIKVEVHDGIQTIHIALHE